MLVLVVGVIFVAVAVSMQLVANQAELSDSEAKDPKEGEEIEDRSSGDGKTAAVLRELRLTHFVQVSNSEVKRISTTRNGGTQGRQ
ncbi:hypothetical protein MLD55_18990 [Alcanivorax sp. MM125-6]|nr:hypothetical protein [Alcanivorax sp. MM125-6]